MSEVRKYRKKPVEVEGTCAVCGRSRPCPTEQAVLKRLGESTDD